MANYRFYDGSLSIPVIGVNTFTMGVIPIYDKKKGWGRVKKYGDKRD